MLREFEGIINSTGLCHFQQTSDLKKRQDLLVSPEEHVVFWAVLEVQAASCIMRELISGSRDRALKLLEETAVSLGSQPANE